MTDGTLEAVLRRDRMIVAGSLGVIVALAWAYVLWLAADMDMGGMDMTGFRMIPAGIGIMAPSAAPMVLMYARVGRQGRAEGKPFAPTGWFAAGYFLVWTGFSLAATTVQWGLEQAALLDSQMASASNALGGIVLVLAGVYQWT